MELSKEQRASFERIVDDRESLIDLEWHGKLSRNTVLQLEHDLEREEDFLRMQTGVTLEVFRLRLAAENAHAETDMLRARLDATTRATLDLKPEADDGEVAMLPSHKLQRAMGFARRNRKDCQLDGGS